MDNKREMMHKILDGDAADDERKHIAHDLEADPEAREEFLGLVNAVRLLEESERREAPPAFTAEVMRMLPHRKQTALGRVKEFLFGGRVLRWNMAAALGTALVAIVAVIAVSRIHREPMMTASPPAAEHVVTVRLTFRAPRAHTVAVAGEFNKWKVDADPMTRTDGTWNIDLKLRPGVYSYSFVVDGSSWVPDPGAQSYEDDGFGSRNAVLRVAI